MFLPATIPSGVASRAVLKLQLSLSINRFEGISLAVCGRDV